MSLSLRAELEIWAAALEAYDKQHFDEALKLFSQISDTSKILTNMGIIYATIGEHDVAVEHFTAATNLDPYLAIAHFQCGVSNFLLGRYDLALTKFQDAYLYLRGNQAIDYEQIGLKFKLYSAEVLFNKGLSQIYLGYPQEGMHDLDEARKEKAIEEHDVIDDAIRDRGECYTVFSIPVDVLYRPSANKLRNAESRDYLGKAKLVASSDVNDAFTVFTGVEKLQQASNLIPRPTLGLERSKSTIQVPSISNIAILPVDKRSETALSKSNATAGPLGRKTSQLPPPALKLQPPVPAQAPPRVQVQASPTQQPTPVLNSTPTPKKPSASALPGISTRGPQLPPPALQPQPPISARALPPVQRQSRLDKFYDDYINTYTDDAPPSLILGSGVVPPHPRSQITRVPSRSAASHRNIGGMGGPSGSVGETLKRKPRRRPTVRRMSMFEEEEDGFVTEEYDEGPWELSNIRVKLHYQDDVRGMTLLPDTPFTDFVERITSKFGVPLNGLRLKFVDEDGAKITLRDESDYELALETARHSVKGRGEGKLEVWCVHV
ncbi:hypothetical protein BS17DRAFT_750579 [Gyrodon lividus]|nr:hypothetical protein BS17DRAFT_750579 [Gyrodon lividus]